MDVDWSVFSLQALYEHSDVQSLYTNDVILILRTYGVEDSIFNVSAVESKRSSSPKNACCRLY